MAQKLKFGNGTWATKEGSTLAYNDENNNFKPLPFNFERDSIATRVNKEGLIEVVGKDIPRIDYKDSADGALLLEPTRTNLITYSEDFSQSYWSKLNLSITSNSVISPDGSLNASSFTQSGGTAEHSIYHTLPTLTSGVEYSGSVFLKYDDWQYFQIRFRSGGFGAEIGVIYDAINKTITTTSGSLLSYKVEEYSNDWVRVSIVAQSTSASNYAGLVVAYNNSGTVFNDPDSVPNTGANAYVWGFQVEQGSYATSYIPTNGSAVPRAAETCNEAGNEQVFNDSEGVLMAEISALDNDGTSRRISLSSGSTSQRVSLEVEENANDIQAIVVSTTSQVGMVVSLPNVTLYNKIAFKYKQNDFAIWGNGFKLDTDIIGNTPIGLSELAFDDGGGGNNFYGKTKELGYYDTALTDEELEYMTSYRSLNELVTELNLNEL